MTGDGARSGAHDMVRPFIMTGGRTRTERRDLRLETMLERVGDPTGSVPSEQRALLELCRQPLSIAEASAHLGLVVGVVSVIAGDLVNQGLLKVHHTDPVEIELDVLSRLIERVRAI